MTKSLTILSLVLLGFSHAGFAQAPKEVIVLDGQVAINNGPLNPASVIVENGVTNPIPVLDITPRTGEGVLGTIPVFPFGTTTPSSLLCLGHIEPPNGKAYLLFGISMHQMGDPGLEYSFELELKTDPTTAAFKLGLTGEKVRTVTCGSGGVIYGCSVVDLTEQFADLPPLKFIGVRMTRSQGSANVHQACRVTFWGESVDAPLL